MEQGFDNIIPIKYTPNISRAQHQALKSLATNPDLVIKSADKGSGIVVEDRSNYIRDGLAHLSDESVYQQIDSDPTHKLAEGLNEFADSLCRNGIIDSITRDYLKFPPENPKIPRTQQMYFLKKIHKSPTAVRPICSGCAGPTERISKLVDHHMRPFVPEIQSYVKDSGHLIEILEKTTLPHLPP